MKKAVKKKWVDALRSGDYRQGRGMLHTADKKQKNDKYCCLGVLCEVLKLPTTYRKTALAYSYDGALVQLPFSVREEHGITSGQQVDLIEMNDRGVPFKQLAKWIEENL